MNIWLLTGEYPPDYGGGIATYCYHTVQMLCQRGHQLTVFTPSENVSTGWQIEEVDGRSRIVRFAANQQPQSTALGMFGRLSFDAACVLEQYCREEGAPDLIESQEYLGLPYFLLQRRYLLEPALLNIPVLVTAHTPLYTCQHYDQQLEYQFPGYWTRELERFSLLAADAIVYPSEHLFTEVNCKLPQMQDRSRVIPNPYSAERTQFEPNHHARKGFLFTAKIERRKGIEPLLAAFSRMWDRGLEEPLFLLGDDWFDQLHQRKMSEKIAQVYGKYIDANLLCWEGKQKPHTVKERLSQVRAMILPSLFENFPYAVLEAMSSGCPVIVSQSGGHAEIVQNGISGYVFSHEKPGDLERKVNDLLGLSESAYEQMCSAAVSRVNQVSGYDKVAPQKETAYAWAIEQKHFRRTFPFLRGKQKSITAFETGSFHSTPDLLSIVIPFYNLGEYLEDTLSSLMNLTGIPVEIIVIDDGSDDASSLQKLNELQARYSFKMIRQQNQGLAKTRNNGAQIAQGEYLAFIDSDDRMAPEFYLRAVQILKHYENVHYVGCWAEYFGEAQGYWPTWNPEPPYALVHNPLNTSALVYRREVFLRFGKNDPDMNLVMEDYESLLNLMENGCRGVAIPSAYFKYRVRGNSMFHVSNDNIRKLAYQKLAHKHAGLYAEYADDVINIITANGPGYLFDNPTLWYPTVDFVREQETKKPEITLADLYALSFPSKTWVRLALRSVFGKPTRKIRRFFADLIGR